MTTLRDVAQAASVSVSTASRYFHKQGYVSADARKRIQSAAEQLGYRPNAVARSLRRRRTLTVALVVPEIENPFFTTISRGVEDVAYAAGYTVFVCNTDEQEDRQDHYLQALLERQVDGLLFIPCGHAAKEHCGYLSTANVPFVLIDRKVPGVEADAVVGNNLQGAEDLMQHLLDLGHRRIGFIGGAPADSVSQQRLAGYRSTLDKAHIDPDSNLVSEGDWGMWSAWSAAKELLASDDPPTAIFCANNVLAVGALRALREASKQVPDDIALVCFDDIELAALLDPFLTVAVQPAYEMGRRAATLLLHRLNGQHDASTARAVLPTHIIIRRSTGGSTTTDDCALQESGWLSRRWASSGSSLEHVTPRVSERTADGFHSRSSVLERSRPSTQ
jgi:LacI family transcriptional regulator